MRLSAGSDDNFWSASVTDVESGLPSGLHIAWLDCGNGNVGLEKPGIGLELKICNNCLCCCETVSANLCSIALCAAMSC